MSFSLTNRIVLGGLVLVAAPLAMVTGLAYRSASRGLHESAEARISDRARDTASGLNSLLESEVRMVAALGCDERFQEAVATAEARGWTEAERATLNEGLKRIAAALGERYAGIFVTDRVGRAIGGVTVSGDPQPYLTVNVADRAYFTACMQTGKPGLSDAVISKSTNEPITVLAAPVGRDGTTLGIVGVTLRLKAIAEEVSSRRIGASGYAFLANRDGLIVAHPKAEHIMKLNINQVAGMETIAREMAAGRTGSEDYVFQGIAKSAGFAPVPLTGWSVAVTQNDDEFFAPVQRFARTSTVIAVVLLALASVVCVWFGRKIGHPLHKVSEEIGSGARVVDDSSRQVSAAAQQLAEMASEQAASLQETSASIEEMASMARQNSSHTEEATRGMAETRSLVETANGGMQTAATAMSGVAKASKETAAIIKTIDEIAFQTNILALNAAVEAARAGEAGAGFAVVAEEVRALANRAAEASRNSAQLIETTSARVGDAVKQVNSCGQLLAEITTHTQKIDKLLGEISQASQEQNTGISEINKAVAQLDQSVQGNAAAAEECSAAAEELSAQSEVMRAEAATLELIVGGSVAEISPPGNGAAVEPRRVLSGQSGSRSRTASALASRSESIE